ncbi:RsmD family RNA methyltransferase [Deinococcus lacus]|uniref:RsmD family RNA methyltransferase n=1 Tax=Deinococcus lacus TaxID=392561 RepID=A0ABW1YES0_9DEIO
MSLRILGGDAKGRVLRVPESARPSGARIRKSFFDLLTVRRPSGGSAPVTLIDLHAGSGAIGLEAASRGYQVTLVEKDAKAIRALEENARSLGLRVKIIRGDAEALLKRLGSFDIVFSDPPYSQDIPRLTGQILRSGVLASGGLLAAQHDSRLTLPPQPGYAAETRVYGSNAVTLYTATLEGE